MEQGFSFASVVLSYFLVGGGLFSGMLIAGLAKVESIYVVYMLMAAGAFVGGFVSARASRGSTVLEPAIGAIALIGTVVGLAAGTEIGKFMWHVSSDGTIKFIALIGGVAGGGAIAGAYISEKTFGEATLSSGPWIVYCALAAFGSCMITTVLGTVLVAGNSTAEGAGVDADALAKMLLAGLAGGCVIAGIAAGASARARPLGAAFLGGALGTAGFAMLIAQTATGGHGDADSAAVIGVFAGGGGILSFLGAALGWAVIGKKRAG